MSCNVLQEYTFLIIILTTCFTSSTKAAALLDVFSSKTVYDAVRGDVRTLPPITGKYGECRPTRMYHLLRHGSRNFGQRITQRMLRFLDKLDGIVRESRARLPRDFLSWYATWSRGRYYHDYELVPEGMVEHFTIGRRFIAAFPDLYPSYYVRNYSVQATTKMRTVQSAMSYLYGVLEGTGPLDNDTTRLNISFTGYYPPGIRIDKNDEDRLLRFVDTCPKYGLYVKSMLWNEESSRFEQGDDFKRVLDDVSSYMNISLTLEDFKAIYYLCAAENMSPSQSGGSRFCSLLTEQNLRVLDFWKDLDKYYKYSYPEPVTSKMSCLLLGDIIQQLNDTNTSNPVLKFAHEETLYPLLTLLDMFKDTPLLTHKTDDYLGRKAKSSQITPFAANVAFIRYSCEAESTPRIRVVLNEKDTSNTWCKDGRTCTLSELQHVLNVRADGCDFNAICGITPEDKTRTTLYYGMGVLVALCLAQATYIFFHCCKRCPYAVRTSKSAVTARGVADDSVLLNSMTSDDVSSDSASVPT